MKKRDETFMKNVLEIWTKTGKRLSFDSKETEAGRGWNFHKKRWKFWVWFSYKNENSCKHLQKKSPAKVKWKKMNPSWKDRNNLFQLLLTVTQQEAAEIRKSWKRLRCWADVWKRERRGKPDQRQPELTEADQGRSKKKDSNLNRNPLLRSAWRAEKKRREMPAKPSAWLREKHRLSADGLQKRKQEKLRKNGRTGGIYKGWPEEAAGQINTKKMGKGTEDCAGSWA